jgi:hypothetical protein
MSSKTFVGTGGHLSVDAGNALEMLLQELVFFGHISDISKVQKTQHQC